MKLFFIANWKMNMLARDVREYIAAFSKQPDIQRLAAETEIGIAPPYLSIQETGNMLKSIFPQARLGALNAHWASNGAHTGEVSVAMLQEFGVQFVVLGHSERRQLYGETNEGVAKRARAVLESGLRAVVCVGETRAQYEAGQTEQVVAEQLTKSLDAITAEMTGELVVAYEPIWAIGTGLPATPEDASRVHEFIHHQLQSIFGKDAGTKIRIIHGGSFTPENAASLTSKPLIAGAIVGGASLKPETFAKLISEGYRGLGQR